MLHRQKFAINFVAIPFLGGFFLLLTQAKFAINFEAAPFLGGLFLLMLQAKVCHKFCSDSIFSRKIFIYCTEAKFEGNQ